MNFDEEIDRRGTHSSKWDQMEKLFGVSPEGGIPMWVADMDFRAPQAVENALRDYADRGVYGYYGDEDAYRAAVAWWAANRHGWQIEADWIFTTHGLVNGTALCLDAFSKPGDGVVLFTPVYHAFARVIRAGGRRVVECPLAVEEGRHVLDLEDAQSRLTGDETMLIFCSPHNPGGRVWTEDELRAVAEFARRNDLILVSDEIHCDLVFPGHRHLPLATAVPEALPRLVMMTAATKTFNIAGAHLGNVIIPDPELRARFAARIASQGISANSMGLFMVTAAFSPEGAEWVDALMGYLDGNRQMLDETLNAIPGVRSMPLEATYLGWADFSGTGMIDDELTRRMHEDARVVPSPGPSFGTGGSRHLRFNFATPRARVAQACERIAAAFSDLQ
ncbi:aminotransferase [Brevirhabdus pacifica]|uniref:cysteine-S-conjugate beta-lyase n=1 Tax=Brevirhabdus pacifica TaxID=1267768 RepID=A0A1U7DJ98_9RHOB|nr:MalY/PatB family protein [Brevirhabdus pacifica]APX90074.1 aminotransferase [Brevirhabdus pacifica]OWU75335.1 aminotransferase [Loktanella sp. 22II-4b]PJJ82673.1 cystathionine beta-lyase [Brevirhabdus pacifica]